MCLVSFCCSVNVLNDRGRSDDGKKILNQEVQGKDKTRLKRLQKTLLTNARLRASTSIRTSRMKTKSWREHVTPWLRYRCCRHFLHRDSWPSVGLHVLEPQATVGGGWTINHSVGVLCTCRSQGFDYCLLHLIVSDWCQKQPSCRWMPPWRAETVLDIRLSWEMLEQCRSHSSTSQRLHERVWEWVFLPLVH